MKTGLHPNLLKGLRIGWELARAKKRYSECIVCGEKIRTTDSRIKSGRGKFCGVKCKAEWQKGKTPTRIKPKEGKNLNCAVCGKQFYAFPGEVKEGRKYCSPGCRYTSEEYKKKISGENSRLWKGGRRMCQGYVYIFTPDHPYRNNAGCVMEHRLTMEKFIGRYLTKNEQVHHKNGIKTDNRIENLEIVIKKMHHGEVVCPHCQKGFKVK